MSQVKAKRVKGESATPSWNAYFEFGSYWFAVKDRLGRPRRFGSAEAARKAAEAARPVLRKASERAA